MSNETYNKAQARLGKMVGYTITVFLNDEQEFKGIFDSFECKEGYLFLVIDSFHKHIIINFAYVKYIIPEGEHT